jgi:tRNA threonylcarbamoyladenosine biosynthesis protein TsaB
MGHSEVKMVVLSVETSGRKGSVALGQEQRIIAEIAFSGMMRHSAELFASIQSLLNQAEKTPQDIRHLYLTVGPGSFTGLRIGITMAKMMSFANDIDIVPVSTMDVIAGNASQYIADTNHRIKRIGTILDAKRKQFYVSIFDRIADGWEKVVPDCLMTSAEFAQKFGESNEPPWLLGEGLVYYEDQFRADGFNIINEEYWYPRAANLFFIGRKLAQQGKFVNAAALKPLYLREPDAVEKSQRSKSQKNHRIPG